MPGRKVVRLSNGKLPCVRWKNTLTEKGFRLPHTGRLGNDMKILARAAGVPQRCISIVINADHEFVVHGFRGCHEPGCFPINSILWETHCGICDDSYSNPEENCPECGQSNVCENCYKGEGALRLCFLCYSDEPGWVPESLREQLLHGCQSNPTYNGVQPSDDSSYTYFPFVDEPPKVRASFVPTSRCSGLPLFDADSIVGQEFRAAVARFNHNLPAVAPVGLSCVTPRYDVHISHVRALTIGT